MASSDGAVASSGGGGSGLRRGGCGGSIDWRLQREIVLNVFHVSDVSDVFERVCTFSDAFGNFPKYFSKLFGQSKMLDVPGRLSLSTFFTGRELSNRVQVQVQVQKSKSKPKLPHCGGAALALALAVALTLTCIEFDLSDLMNS